MAAMSSKGKSKTQKNRKQAASPSGDREEFSDCDDIVQGKSELPGCTLQSKNVPLDNKKQNYYNYIIIYAVLIIQWFLLAVLCYEVFVTSKTKENLSADVCVESVPSLTEIHKEFKQLKEEKGILKETYNNQVEEFKQELSNDLGQILNELKENYKQELREFEHELKGMYNRLFLAEMSKLRHNYNRQKKYLEQKLGDNYNRIENTLRQQINKIKQEVKEFELELNGMHNKLFWAEMSKLRHNYNRQKKYLEQKLRDNFNRIENTLRQQINKIKYDDYEEVLKSLRNQIGNHTEMISDLETRSGKCGENIKTLKLHLSALKREIKKNRQKQQMLRGQTLAAIKLQAENNMHRHLKQIKIHTEMISDLETRSDKCGENIETLKLQLRALKREIKENRQKQQMLRGQTLAAIKLQAENNRHRYMPYNTALIICIGYGVLIVILLIMIQITKNGNTSSHVEESVSPILDKIHRIHDLENSLCIISFSKESETIHSNMVNSFIEEGINKTFYIVRGNDYLLGMPHSKFYMVFIDYNDRNIILETAIGLRKTTVKVIWKMGGDVILVYCGRAGHSKVSGTELYNSSLSSKEEPNELKQLKSKQRLLSVDNNAFTEHQKQHLRQLIGHLRHD